MAQFVVKIKGRASSKPASNHQHVAPSISRDIPRWLCY